MSRREHCRESAGLTLIEVAMAIGLLGLVLTAALTATTTGLQAWLAARSASAIDRREANWNDQLHAAIGAMIPVAVQPGSSPGSRRAFFQGAPSGMRFVTAHAPATAGRDGIRLIEVRCEQFDDGIRLVLLDAPCPSSGALGRILGVPVEGFLILQPNRMLQQVLAGSPSRIIADGLSRCEFHFLPRPSGPPGSAQWVSRWEDATAIPRAVRIESVLGGNVDEAPQGRRVSITAAVNVELLGERDLAAWR